MGIVAVAANKVAKTIAKKRRNKNRGLGKKGVLAIVKREISRNIENKVSPAINTDGYVGQWPVGFGITWFRKTLSSDLDTTLGDGHGQRIGNQFKLKRWIVKGTIHPSQEVDPTITTTDYLRYSFQGYATLYLLKQRNGDEPPVNLPQFYQNGNSTNSAAGTYLDHLLAVNKDRYKVYFRRRFKLGPSASNQWNSNNKMLSNNDFKLVGDFGFDICKYVGKNAIIKFNDSGSTAYYPVALRGLSIMVVWSPPFGNFAAQTLATSTTFYKVSCSSYFEYEDA